MDHPPPPKTSVEKVKIIKNITTPVLEKPLKTYTITTPRPVGKTIIKQPKKSFTTSELYNLIKNPKLSTRKKYHVIKGTDKEPDVRICLDNISPPCNVLSIGIANIWHFDDFMLKQGCRVWSYDPSMKPKL